MQCFCGCVLLWMRKKQVPPEHIFSQSAPQAERNASGPAVEANTVHPYDIKDNQTIQWVIAKQIGITS